MKIYSAIKDFLFFDIETVREYVSYDEMITKSKRSPALWERAVKKMMADENLTPEQAYLKKSGLFVEYAKIVSLAWGRFDAELKPIIGAITNNNEIITDEKQLLEAIAAFFTKVYDTYPETILCGHNIKEFDIPFIVKRMIYHRIRIPQILLNYLGAKTWDQKATDTLYDYRMAGMRFMSLDAIAEFLGIPSSKTGDVDGSRLGDFYFAVNDMPMVERVRKINNYCKEDIRVEMELAKRFYESL